MKQNPTPVLERPDSAAGAPEPAAGQRRHAFLILFASLVCVGIGQSLVFAVLPPAARDLGLSEVAVGGIFTVSAALWMLMSPVWGRVSDRWGRRPVILLGLGGYALSMTAFAASLQIGLAGWLALLPTYLLLIAARSLYGLLGSAAVPAAQAFVADRTAAAERASQLAQLTAAFSLGVIVAPVVVAALVGIGLAAPFYAVGLLGFVSMLVVALWLPEARAPRQHRRPGARLRALDARVRPYLLVAVALEISQAVAMMAAGFYAIDVLGLSATESARLVGVALMGTAAAILFAQLVVIRLLRPAPRSMIGFGALAGVGGFALIVAAGAYPALFAGMLVLGLGLGLLRPGVMAGASLAVGVDEQGGVAGLMNATGGFGVIVAPFVGMSLYQFLPQAPYLLCLALFVLVLLAAWRHPRLRG